MVVNDIHRDGGSVKFVSYTGRYPTMCRGVLTLEVNGKEYMFGHDYERTDWEHDGNHDAFWESGGDAVFNEETQNCDVKFGEWKVLLSKLPDELVPYAYEIDKVINANMEYGCCGGCAVRDMTQ